MNAVIYARYSSDSQREESIEGQLRECTTFANREGYTVLQHYIDRAYSATTDKRPEFQRMIKDSSNGLFDFIIVWKLDRFARDRYDSARYKALLKKRKVRVISATESISDDPSGILMEAVLEGMAEYYSADLAEKVVRGHTENLIKGKYNGGVLTLGYKINSEHRYEKDEFRAPYILETFKRYDVGYTKKEIRDWLNENNFTNTKGAPMTYHSVGTMLKNRKYIGEYKFRDHINYDAVPAIVPKDLFERVQIRLKKNRAAPAHFKANEEYILSSKLFCGHCKSSMCGESGTSCNKNTYYYYKCTSVKGRKNNCKKKSIRKEWIEDIVINEITKVIFDDDTVESIVSMAMKLQSEEKSKIPMWEKEFDKTQVSIDNILNAIQQGIFTESTKTRLDELEERKRILSADIAAEKLRKPRLQPEKVRNWLYKLRTLDIKKIEYRRVLINTFVNKIFLYDDKIIITFNYKSDTKEVTFKNLDCSGLKNESSP